MSQHLSLETRNKKLKPRHSLADQLDYLFYIYILNSSSSAHFSVQERRDKIMSSVLDLLKIDDDDEILRYGIEALVEIIRINF